MADILYFPRHRYREIPGMEGCAECVRCQAFEGEIPTDCPGVPMTAAQRVAVFNQELDYVWKEGWTTWSQHKRIMTRYFCTNPED